MDLLRRDAVRLLALTLLDGCAGSDPSQSDPLQQWVVIETGYQGLIALFRLNGRQFVAANPWLNVAGHVEGEQSRKQYAWLAADAAGNAMTGNSLPSKGLRYEFGVRLYVERPWEKFSPHLYYPAITRSLFDCCAKIENKAEREGKKIERGWTEVRSFASIQRIPLLPPDKVPEIAGFDASLHSQFRALNAARHSHSAACGFRLFPFSCLGL